jgi:hypothetical protein
MLYQLKKNQKGGTLLVYVVIVFSSMMTVVFALNSIVLNGLKVSNIQSESTKAYFAAEAGAEWLVRKMNIGGYDPGTCNVNQYINVSNLSCLSNDSSRQAMPGNNAEFYIKRAEAVFPIEYDFKIYGEFNDIKRVIEIKF